jgi:hypothetical protein
MPTSSWNRRRLARDFVGIVAILPGIVRRQGAFGR